MNTNDQTNECTPLDRASAPAPRAGGRRKERREPKPRATSRAINIAESLYGEIAKVWPSLPESERSPIAPFVQAMTEFWNAGDAADATAVLSSYPRAREAWEASARRATLPNKEKPEPRITAAQAGDLAVRVPDAAASSGTMPEGTPAFVRAPGASGAADRGATMAHGSPGLVQQTGMRAPAEVAVGPADTLESMAAPSDDAVLVAAPELFRIARESTTACAVVFGHVERAGLYAKRGYKTMREYAGAELAIASDGQFKKVRAAATAVWRHYAPAAQAVLGTVSAGYARNPAALPRLPDLTSLARLEAAVKATPEADRARLVADVAEGKLSTRELEGIARRTEAHGKTPGASAAGARQAAPVTIDAPPPGGQGHGELPTNDDAVAAPDRLVGLETLLETLRAAVVDISALDLAAESAHTLALQERATKELHENMATVEALITVLRSPPPSGGSRPHGKHEPAQAGTMAPPTVVATESAAGDLLGRDMTARRRGSTPRLAVETQVAAKKDGQRTAERRTK